MTVSSMVFCVSFKCSSDSLQQTGRYSDQTVLTVAMEKFMSLLDSFTFTRRLRTGWETEDVWFVPALRQ